MGLSYKSVQWCLGSCGRLESLVRKSESEFGLDDTKYGLLAAHFIAKRSARSSCKMGSRTLRHPTACSSLEYEMGGAPTGRGDERGPAQHRHVAAARGHRGTVAQPGLCPSVQRSGYPQQPSGQMPPWLQ